MNVAFWLVPAEPHKSAFSDVIHRLAAQFDAPMFAPHVTLYSGPLAQSDSPAEIVASAAPGFRSLTLKATRLSSSDEFTKTLFVEFAPDQMLTHLAEALRIRLAQSAEYELRPHLSLIYASIPQETRRMLSQTVSLPREVVFDTVQAIVTPDATRTRADVEAWQAVAAQALR